MDKRGKWIRFEELEQPVHRKTRRWCVLPRDGVGPLGYVEWYTPWRKYVFAPVPNTVFEQDCLRDLASFCEDRTREQRERRVTT